MQLDRILAVTGKAYHSNSSNKNFDWLDELINAGILAGITFFSTVTVTDNLFIGVKIALVSSALTFLTRLAITRKILKR